MRPFPFKNTCHLVPRAHPLATQPNRSVHCNDALHTYTIYTQPSCLRNPRQPTSEDQLDRNKVSQIQRQL